MVPPDSETPWIETKAGGLFFLNALLVGPVLLVLFPVLLGTAVRGLGWVEGPSPILDTIPAVAEYVAPVVGWAALPAGWFVLRSLRETRRRGARLALWGFLAIHAGVLAYTVSLWVG